MVIEMRPYSIDLREKIVEAAGGGMTYKAIACIFGVCPESVYRYCAAAKNGDLTPKTRKSHPKKIDPDALTRDVEKFPDSTLKERAARFGAIAPSIRKRLLALGITQKKRRRFIAGATNSTAGSLSGISKS